MSDATPISLGSGGWRGVLGEEFTFARARALASAVGAWAARERPGAAVLVAHDTRFLADRAAAEVAAELVAGGASVLLARGATATPVACRGVVRRGCAAGLVVTASHNPPEYLGIKVIGASGASVSRAVGRVLERDAVRRLAGPLPGGVGGRARRADLRSGYLAELSRLLDRDVFRGGRLEVVYDALHGAGAGLLDALLARCGARVIGLRLEPDPRFGGGPPDPTPARLALLARSVRARPGSRLGLATDGDGDRLAAVSGDGAVLSQAEWLALLLDHLAVSRRLRGSVALSRAAGSLPARVAEDHGLRVVRSPVGFAALASALAAGEAEAAGDESGGFAWAPFARDKDGILAGALLAERAAREGGDLRTALRALERRLGRAACGRAAVPWAPERAAALARLAAAPPARFDGQRVVAADAAEGVHLALADGGFVLWRASGTEPALRLYAEAGSRAALRRRLTAAARLLARAAR